MIVSHPSGDLDLLPEFPAIWDSSMRSAFVACPRQWYYGYLLALRKAGLSVHLHFGGAVAHGLEAARKSFYGKGKTEVQAVADGLKALIQFWGDFELTDELQRSRSKVKDLSGCIDALYSYFENYPLSDDVLIPLAVGGELLIEKSFALPVPDTKHPVTGEPIIYAGRFDMLAQHRDGASLYVVDEKTALSLGDSWQSNWPLRGQLTGYVWGARQYGLEPDAVVVRGIGILMGSITHAQAVLTRPQWQVDQWLRQLARDINRAATLWQEGVGYTETPHVAFDQAFDSACSAFNGCGYRDLCNAQSPVPWYDNFTVSRWDPLQRVGDIP